jgi:hypothetical protein
MKVFDLKHEQSLAKHKLMFCHYPFWRYLQHLFLKKHKVKLELELE